MAYRCSSEVKILVIFFATLESIKRPHYDGQPPQNEGDRVNASGCVFTYLFVQEIAYKPLKWISQKTIIQCTFTNN